MLIQRTSISVMYPKIEGIKKAYYADEEILKKYFGEATVLPVPENAPVEIPRIILKTLNEHAQLNISPIATTFEVVYNNGFEKNWDDCSKYIMERMSSVFEFLNLLTNDHYDYIGLVSYILYNEIDKEPVKKLSNTLLNSKSITNLFDINVKYTFIEKNNIFVNIMLQNARIFPNDSNTNEAGNFSKQLSEYVGAIIDVNDRYGFNINPNYKSNSDVLSDLINSMSNIITSKLKPLIEEGVY